ncbi:MAG: lipase [Pseudonocardiales bacterium]
MSRRRLIAGLISAVVVLGVVIGVALTIAGSRHPTPAAAPQDRPGPVLLVPGYGGEGSGLLPLAARLRSQGRLAEVITLPGIGTGDLREQAKTLGAAAKAALARTGAASVDVVGYSAGGVVARLWTKSYGGAALARRIITVGSPHHGTDLAGLASALDSASCPAACQQLSPGSSLLGALNRGDETPAGPRWVSLWSTNDQVVTPPDSARLSGALNVVLQDVCPHVRVEHGELPASPLVESIVLADLGAAAVTAPQAGECGRLR